LRSAALLREVELTMPHRGKIGCRKADLCRASVIGLVHGHAPVRIEPGAELLRADDAQIDKFL
jgi:hypothetical protein